MIMIRLADDLRKLSTDKDVQFGCVIFPLDCSAVDGIGYNGMPAGIDDLPRGPLDTPGGSGYCHAEMNALTKMNVRSAGPSLLFVHRTPCMRCAGQIINARKIVGIIHEEPYEADKGAGLRLIGQAGIACVHRRDVEDVAAGASTAIPGALQNWWMKSRMLSF